MWEFNYDETFEYSYNFYSDMSSILPEVTTITLLQKYVTYKIGCPGTLT